MQDWGEEPLDADADPTTEGVMMEDPNYQEPEAAPQEGGASSSASPAKKAGNKGSSSSKGSPGVDGDEGARGDKQPAMLPTVYFLNLDEEKDMRRRVEKDLSKYTDKLVRVPAVDKAQVLKCLDDGSCAKDDKAQVLGTDYLNTEGYLYWQLHRKNVFSPGELGCSFSHLKAIHQVNPTRTPTPKP